MKLKFVLNSIFSKCLVKILTISKSRYLLRTTPQKLLPFLKGRNSNSNLCSKRLLIRFRRAICFVTELSCSHLSGRVQRTMFSVHAEIRFRAATFRANRNFCFRAPSAVQALSPNAPLPSVTRPQRAVPSHADGLLDQHSPRCCVTVRTFHRASYDPRSCCDVQLPGRGRTARAT